MKFVVTEQLTQNDDIYIYIERDRDRERERERERESVWWVICCWN